MSLPGSVRVKLSSEAAEWISITQVVSQEMAVRDLVEHMLGVTGKDESRVRELLLRGTLVSGASRFRWEGWDAAPEDVRSLLATFPDPEPDRPFSAEHCIHAILRGGRSAIEIPRQAGIQKPLFRRRSFWDLLMAEAAAEKTTYAGYSYRERADCYRIEFPFTVTERLRAGSRVLKYSTLRRQILNGGFTCAELFVERR
jgi:hypothetical protein